MRKGIAVLLVTMIMVLSGCGARIEAEKSSSDSDNKSMFVQVENGIYYKIFYHRQTRVMYAMSDGDYNHGTFTVMLDADGKPLLYGN